MTIFQSLSTFRQQFLKMKCRAHIACLVLKARHLRKWLCLWLGLGLPEQAMGLGLVAHVQGVKQLVCSSVVVGMKITKSRDIDFIGSDKRCQTVRIIDKTIVLCF